MAHPSKRVLGIFAKQPILGQAKTRLAAATSDQWAQQVAQAFLEDSLDRFSAVDAARVIAYAPAEALSYFQAVARERFDLVPQSDGDLGRRLHDFFESQRRQGYSRIVVVGTDSPTLPMAHVERAFELLETHDVVIAPAFDGGYCLIGGNEKETAMFAGIPWSTPRVLDATVERLRASSVRLALLPPWYDVDTADDWAMLCGHVRAMRLAGIDPGVPRVEALS
jgi:rSAM/selenodomain-associated transferase 1